MNEEEMILKILGKSGELTTSEIEKEFTKKGVSCPDGAVKHLMRMKGKKLVIGRMDKEKKGWVWSRV